jgi:hypothetical protein
LLEPLPPIGEPSLEPLLPIGEPIDLPLLHRCERRQKRR